MKKKLLIIFSLFFTTISLFSQTQYQQGFNEGFKNGYCHGQIAGCVAPIAPIAPVTMNMNYQSGYNNGFIEGQKVKQNQNSYNNTGGALGQIRPLESNTQNLQLTLPTYDPEVMRKQWEDYYERRRIKKLEKDRKNIEYTNSYYEENSTVNTWINDLELKLTSQNVEKSKINEIISRFKIQNEKIFQKYFKKQSRFKNYLSEMNRLKNEILYFEYK